MKEERLATVFTAIKAYAEEHHVPIMEEQGISQLIDLLHRQRPETVLEIGSAIGFSALKMAQALPSCRIDTIEREDSRYEKAVEFIGNAELDGQIRIFHGDALEMELSNFLPAYDAIFIDAAKGQYERFFTKYEVLLEAGGVIYCDNMLMHGMSDLPLSEIPRRKRTMIRNLKRFREQMMLHPSYETALLPVGDGIMVCKKK